MVGLNELEDELIQIEKLAKEEVDVDTISPIWDRFKTKLDNHIPILESTLSKLKE